MNLRISNQSRWTPLFVLYHVLLSVVVAERTIESTALYECQSNSSFTASLFNILFFPNNNTLRLNVIGDSSYSGNITLGVDAAAYGFSFLTETLNPCTMNLDQFCPMQVIQISFDTTYNNISTKFISNIPPIAYGVPDLDATVTVRMMSAEDPTVSLACARSQLSNGKTVHQSGVGWATAAVAGIGLLTSALISGLGYSNTASHIAVYASSLFNYFQAVAIIGLCAVPLPPIVQSWTQDFSWSIGIIRVGFLQRLATWYQIATKGTPTTVLQTLGTKSVQVFKRSTSVVPDGEYTVKGIQRVAFRAGIESTNLFLTGLIFYCIFVIFTLLGVVAFKKLCDLAVRMRWMKDHRFENLRKDFRITLKGIIFRILLIGYPNMTILCLWEFTQIDSAGEVALAVLVFFGMSAALVFAICNVFRIARRSQQSHKTPAYGLYGDTVAFNKWGFFYIQFRASAYYYIVPTFAFIFLKGVFVALAQGSGVVQAIAILLIEAAALISASVLRPWMDKPTNAINISICSINFVNAILLLIYTDVFNGPGLLIGVTGIVFFLANSIFALVLLFIVLIATLFSLLQKNPDTRYETMTDNRASFIKSQTALPSELDALGYTARGGQALDEKYRDPENTDTTDAENDDEHRHSSDIHHMPLGTAYPNDSFHESQRSPVSPSMPFLPGHVSRSDVRSLNDSNRSLANGRADSSD